MGENDMKENLKESDSISRMDKPFTLIYEDFRQKMADLINNSGLPPFVVESILQNYLYETRDVARRQYQHDKIQYEKNLKTEDLSEKNEENQKG